MKRQSKGFTLIELVIVLVILGILAAVAVPQFYNATGDAQNAAKANGKNSVATALAVAIAKNKGTATGSEVATQLPGSVCEASSGKIWPGGTAGTQVSVQLLNVAGTAVADCSTAVGGVGVAAYI